MGEFKKILQKEKELIDAIIRSEFDRRLLKIYVPLYEAIEYSLFSGGKRVRPILLKWCAELGDPDEKILDKAISAIEYIHTYSLIHDDLPAMDNDDMRRGKPTSHKKFGEAIAILAGDALLTEAFFLLGETGMSRLSMELADYAGPIGMVGGQAADIYGTMDINYINERKTANLFKVSALLGGIIGGVDDNVLGKLADYGMNIGKAFQLRDDILDTEYKNRNAVIKEAKRYISNAKNAISGMYEMDMLNDFADYIISRKN